VKPDRPFARRDVVDRYEDWYSTPYGSLADRIERAMLLELLLPVGQGASVLDIGCGTGHFSAALDEAGFRVTGVDPELAMLAIASQRLPVACADGLHLPFEDGAFDAAVFVAVLKFVPDPVALLVEARRVARRRVVVLALSSRSWLGLRRRISAWLGHSIFSHATFRSRARIVALAREAGAKPARTRTALFLPPSIACRVPRIEESLSRRALPCGGILGLALPGGVDGCASEPLTIRPSSTMGLSFSRGTPEPGSAGSPPG